MAEIYVSTDIEADGPIPGPYSMLSLGSAAFDEGGEMVATYSVNLETLPDAGQHPVTMDWWKTQPAAWQACRENLRDPAEAMAEYAAWLNGLNGDPVFVAYPLGFDFMFVHWYLVNFVGDSPFSFAGLDLKSFAMALMRTPFRDTVKRNMPRAWTKSQAHPHVALDDAITQGLMFCRMLAASREQGS